MHNNDMNQEKNIFTSFISSIDCYILPERFTFPFYYEPHPLCVLAAKELQNHLKTHTQWLHYFDDVGKMFGVLLVQNEQGEVGYLSAFSGKIVQENIIPNFVPPVVNVFAHNEFFRTEQVVINHINAEIESLEKNPNIKRLQDITNQILTNAESEVEVARLLVIENRKDRKEQRDHARDKLSVTEILKLQGILSKESVADKNKLKQLKQEWDEKINKAQKNVEEFTNIIISLKNKRKKLSSELQLKIFEQYQFLNIKGENKNLTEIFNSTAYYKKYGSAPAGSGDCAAPKLLQYAFKNKMKPLAMAEFWWGKSPKSEVRQHKNFYPSCLGKCQPILLHMLDGMTIDDNPLINSSAEKKLMNIIYQDEVMIVINKPSELLSVPGKNIDDSVYSRVKLLFPEATGPLIVHRLDMSTSGLMVIALTKKAHKKLQKQFIDRTIQKRYVATLEGKLIGQQGMINLPLTGDFYDRPRQLVCHQEGKSAETVWEMKDKKIKSQPNTENKSSDTKIYLYPKTGRTHQLRVHCAHVQGLNNPILGDDLYGTKQNRLHLHAEKLELFHPVSKKRMTFQVDETF